MKMKLLVFSLIIFFIYSSAFSQTGDEKYAKDVKSIDAIITAYYNVISGASTDILGSTKETQICIRTRLSLLS